ncbi:50S ribosomal protein L40e [Candidatus Woesearchaeota archaeon]|nr:50S ribosomal protein L40e [Candidatus Woesearchaeota archaeon]
MVKFPEADARMFRGKFVCRRCKTAIHAPIQKVMAGRATCRKCGGHVLRPKRKK